MNKALISLIRELEPSVRFVYYSKIEKYAVLVGAREITRDHDSSLLALEEALNYLLENLPKQQTNTIPCTPTKTTKQRKN